MPQATPILALPYPAGGDGPDGPGAVAALALAVDAIVGAAWQPFNPAFSNAGGLSAAGEYLRVGRHVHFMGQATFGSSGTADGQIGMSLPVARRGSTQISGRIFGVDTGAGLYELVPILTSASTVALYYRSTASNALQPTTNSQPFGWGNTDQILWDFWYGVD